MGSTGSNCSQSKPARMCRSWEYAGSLHPHIDTTLVSKTEQAFLFPVCFLLFLKRIKKFDHVSPLWWLVRVWSTLNQISRFAEGTVSYFRSSTNIFRTQLQPIPIPIWCTCSRKFDFTKPLMLRFSQSTPMFFHSLITSQKSQWPRAGLPLNSVVRILDLQKRPELNGQLGTVVGWDTVEDRCQAIRATLQEMGFESHVGFELSLLAISFASIGEVTSAYKCIEHMSS